jgi:hypothetical protein
MPSVAELRADLLPFVLAVLLLATGLAALCLALFSRSRREALLISYAAFVSLYAVRLAAGTSWARGVLGFDPRLLAYVQALVTYWITAPAVLFFTRALGPRFGRLFRGLLAVLLAYALVASLADAGHERGYQAGEVAIGPGDRLLLFTDGLIEAANARDEHFGLERLERVLAEGAALEAEALADRLLAELGRHRGVEGFEDDVTLLVADVLPDGFRATEPEEQG